MRKALLLAGLLLVGCQEAQKSDSGDITPSKSGDQYVGFTHGPLPQGVTRNAWILLDSINGHDYSLTALSEGKKRMVWLDQSTAATNGRDWKVVEVLAFDYLPTGYSVTAGTCTGLNLPSREIIAVVQRDQPNGAATVVSAWHANRAKNSFDPLRTAAIVCK